MNKFKKSYKIIKSSNKNTHKNKQNIIKKKIKIYKDIDNLFKNYYREKYIF
jgi:hypothetical protein